jgi:hypothetical protein
MKNAIMKVVVGFAVVAVVGLVYWYYDSGGQSDSSTARETAVISLTAGDASSSADGFDFDALEASTTISSTPTRSTTGATASSGGNKASSATNIAAAKKATTFVATSSTASSAPVVITTTTTKKLSTSTAQAAVLPKVSSLSPPKTCTFRDASGDPSHRVTLYEIAWMGSIPVAGETALQASNREWIELKNNSAQTIDLSGWQIIDAAGNIDMIVGDASTTNSGVATNIPTNGFYLLVRGGGSVGTAVADDGYTGSLPNGGDSLALFTPDCVLSDLISAVSGWPGGDNDSKRTLERDRNDSGWHTSASPGGTPRAENSIPAVVMASPITTSSRAVSSTNASINPGASFVSSSTDTGEGIDTSSSTHATSTEVSITTSTPTSTPDVDTPDTDSSSTPAASSSIDHLLIAAVQIAGASSSNDFVKLFNPTAAPIDLAGWKLRKKSSTGTDASLRVFTAEDNAVIQPGGYIIWANAGGGFAEGLGAKVSSTATLSADNSIALWNSDGILVDAVAWGTGIDPYVEGTAYPENPEADQILMRDMATDGMVDTNDNLHDFSIH